MKTLAQRWTEWATHWARRRGIRSSAVYPVLRGHKLIGMYVRDRGMMPWR